VIGTIAETWPDADLQYLRTLRRNALKEREAGRPPKAFREIFRVLRELEEGSAEAGSVVEGEADLDGQGDRADQGDTPEKP
jgi:ribosome-associated protein